MAQNIILLQELSEKAVDNDLVAMQLKSGFCHGQKDVVVKIYANKEWAFYRYFVACVIGGTEVTAEGQCAVRKSDNECFSLIRSSNSHYFVSLGNGATVVFELRGLKDGARFNVEDLMGICLSNGKTAFSSVDVKMLTNLLDCDDDFDLNMFQEAVDKTVYALGNINLRYTEKVYLAMRNILR